MRSGTGEAPPWRGTWRRCALEPLASGRLSRSIPARAGNPAPGAGPDRGRTLPAPALAKQLRPMPDCAVGPVNHLGQGPERAASSAPRPAAARRPLHRVAQERLLGPRPPPSAHRSLPPAKPAHCRCAAGGVKAEAATVRPHGTFSERTGRFSGGRSASGSVPSDVAIFGTVSSRLARDVFLVHGTFTGAARHVFGKRPFAPGPRIPAARAPCRRGGALPEGRIALGTVRPGSAHNGPLCKIRCVNPRQPDTPDRLHRPLGWRSMRRGPPSGA